VGRGVRRGVSGSVGEALAVSGGDGGELGEGGILMW